MIFMKQKIFLFACLIFGSVIIASGQGFQRQTVEERVAAIHQKLDSAFKLPAEKFAVLDSALTILFKAQDTKMQELFSAGNMDRETMMAERKKYTDARDEMIKAMLTEEQFTIWMEKIVPTLRGGRGPGGGGFNRQNQR
jgi:hypothetical protein